jgi:hypothetical protein
MNSLYIAKISFTLETGAIVAPFTSTCWGSLNRLRLCYNADTNPPTTRITIGRPSYVDNSGKEYVTSTTSFQLIADDGPTGSGISAMGYKISNKSFSTEWTLLGDHGISSSYFQLPNNLTDGEYIIGYNSTDKAGNVELAKTINITLFSWDYVFEDDYGRGTTLKINIANCFFQLISQKNDYGIRIATWMEPIGTTLVIKHNDGELSLNNVNTEKEIGSCLAIARDLRTFQLIILVQRPREYSLLNATGNNTDERPLVDTSSNPASSGHLWLNMRDVGTAARAFNTVPGDALWNPDADVTGPAGVPDGRVNLMDIGFIAKHYGDAQS